MPGRGDGTDGADGAGAAFAELVAVMDRLRVECAWKASQTHDSLLRYLLEEAYEVVDAVEAGTADDLREELGDLLLQVVFHARVAQEGPGGRTPFDVTEVVEGITAKLRRRNPHVFGEQGHDAAGSHLPPIDRDDPEAVNARWEQVKALEKPRAHLMDGVPERLPALLTALKAAERLDRAGGLPAAPAAGSDVTSGPDLGEQLWALVVQAHRAGVDPEQALRDTVRRQVDGPPPPP